jgi:hypothetical protein
MSLNTDKIKQDLHKLVQTLAQQDDLHKLVENLLKQNIRSRYGSIQSYITNRKIYIVVICLEDVYSTVRVRKFCKLIASLQNVDCCTVRYKGKRISRTSYREVKEENVNNSTKKSV